MKFRTVRMKSAANDCDLFFSTRMKNGKTLLKLSLILCRIIVLGYWGQNSHERIEMFYVDPYFVVMLSKEKLHDLFFLQIPQILPK